MKYERIWLAIFCLLCMFIGASIALIGDIRHLKSENTELRRRVDDMEAAVAEQ